MKPLMNGSDKRIKIDANRPITPPNLLGMARKIAQANKKYHSGTIWAGVDNELARMKLSGSPRRFGLNRTSHKRAESMIQKPKTSLIVKYQWNGILSAEETTPSGLLLPVLCSMKICTTTVNATNNGTTKWKVKKRVRVALSTEKPPQSHRTKSSPIQGSALNRLVMTVAPQKLICPHGRT